jgi:bacillithiol system protein YtxJ
MRWNPLTSIGELEEVIKLSESIPVLILKHSTRCGISSIVLARLERFWKDEDDKKIVPYFLNLIQYRDVSNEIENRFGIMHESPQVLLIKNGKCVYSATHSDINYADIMAQV